MSSPPPPEQTPVRRGDGCRLGVMVSRGAVSVPRQEVPPMADEEQLRILKQGVGAWNGIVTLTSENGVQSRTP